MRCITVFIEACSQSAEVIAFKALRRAIPDANMSSTLAALRSNLEVISIETDCPEWRKRLNLIIDLADSLDAAGLSYQMKIAERFPSPMSSADLSQNKLASELRLVEIFGDPHKTADWKDARVSDFITRKDLAEIIEFETSIEVRALPRSVTSLLGRLRQSDWFSKVGRELNDQSVILGTVGAAQMRQPTFDEVSLEFRNLLSATLCYNFHYHYNRCWNEVVKRLSPQLDDLLEQKLHKPLVPVSDDLAASLRSTILGACIETFFSPQVSPPAIARWADWIVLGHIPYGWSGDTASGCLIVA